MSRRRRGAEDDELVWWWSTRDVAPLPGVAPPPRPAAADRPAPVAETKPEPTGLPAAPRAPAEPPPALAPGHAPGLDRRTAQRLARGIIPIAAELDLHGMSRTRARDALAAFLARAQGRERACVRVITGHGRRGAEGAGVLRDAVPRWLNDPDLRPLVLGFATAQPRDGGQGAYYVLIRKKG